MNISAVLALVAIGAVLGCVLGIANKYLVVEEDNRVTEVIEMLPEQTVVDVDTQDVQICKCFS